MILLTKLDNTPILLNLESVKYVESMPDTLIFFLNGDSVIVKETMDQVREAALEYKRSIISRTPRPEGA